MAELLEAVRPLMEERNAPVVQVPGLLTSSSSVSTSTVDTELPSPATTSEEQHGVTLVGRLESTSPTSLLRHDASSSDERDSSVESFPTLEPKKGAKRTASGAVKVVDEDVQISIVGKTRERKASELSEQLKTRLKYAMLKVERGWQSQSLDEIESLSNSNQNSPVAPSTRRRRSLSSDIYITSPVSKPSAPSRAFRAFEYSMEEPFFENQHQNESTRISSSLAPAARILSTTRKQQNRRSLNEFRRPPSLIRSSQTAVTDQSGPRTPTSGKFAASQSTGFTPMLPNQAEMDAVDSLLFMSSPNNSNSIKKHAGSQSRPPGLDRQNSGKKVNFLLD